MIRDCQECIRLWREYSATTATHVKLAAALGFALQDKLPVIESLMLELEALDEIRAAIRDAIWRHRGTHTANPWSLKRSLRSCYPMSLESKL